MSGIIRRYFRQAWSGIRTAEAVFALAALAVSAFLAVLPSGYQKAGDRSVRARAVVLETWDEGVRNFGIVMQGEQVARVRVLRGRYRGLEFEANNIIYGKMDIDKIYRPGDVALVVIDPGSDAERPAALTLIDHYRLRWELALLVAFFVLLLLYGGWTGLKTLAAFVFTAVAVWKLLIPAFLAGMEPVATSLGLVALLSGVICYLVAGFTRCGTAAFLGSLWGTGASAAIALALSRSFHLNGAVRPFSETLLYGGFDNLDLTRIFLAGTFLASSGAIMDLAIDIAAAMEEVHRKRPELGFLPLLSSGFTVGRKVFGTMTTTLLLAYTGGFTSLLMVFMAQGVPFQSMFTMSYVSSEVFHTMIGSLGLVLVAPLTALLAAALYSRRRPAAKP